AGHPADAARPAPRHRARGGGAAVAAHGLEGVRLDRAAAGSLSRGHADGSRPAPLRRARRLATPRARPRFRVDAGAGPQGSRGEDVPGIVEGESHRSERSGIYSREARKVLSWDPDQLPYGVGALLSGAARGSSPRAEQAQAEIGVTGCHGAIAETGSLAVLSGPGHSRSVSLLPPVHVAIVSPPDFCFTMGEFFARAAGRIGEAA